MKTLKKYDINIDKLSNKKHVYEFDLDNAFFDIFEQNIIHGGNLKADVELDKTELLLTFNVHIKGEVRLTCDRSLEEFSHPIETEQTLLVKYGQEEAELDENVWQIQPGTQAFNIAQHLFDYVGLAVPMKKLCPRFLEELDEDSDEDILIYSSGGEEADDEDEETVDPRWAALKKLSQGKEKEDSDEKE